MEYALYLIAALLGAHVIFDMIVFTVDTIKLARYRKEQRRAAAEHTRQHKQVDVDMGAFVSKFTHHVDAAKAATEAVLDGVKAEVKAEATTEIYAAQNITIAHISDIKLKMVAQHDLTVKLFELLRSAARSEITPTDLDKIITDMGIIPEEVDVDA